MKNKSVLVSAILCSSSLLAQQKPNIVLIVADDMRGSTLEFMGKEQIKTPTLNQLAQVSVFFNNAHIMGGTSAAVSMPSRAMLMTGKYLYNLESKGATIPNEHTIIGEMLRGAGYNTFHTGKWHNGKDSFNRSFSQGNDIFFWWNVRSLECSTIQLRHFWRV